MVFPVPEGISSRQWPLSGCKGNKYRYMHAEARNHMAKARDQDGVISCTQYTTGRLDTQRMTTTTEKKQDGRINS
jgi:hypothetical protein